MRTEEGRSVVLFDGVCNLCNGAVRFVIDRDPEGRFAFAPLQSDFALKRLTAAGIEPAALDGIVLIDAGRVRTRSDAVLGIVGRLRRPWPWLAALRIVPHPLRDAAYNLVARHRYRLFGRQARCRLPTQEEAARFVATVDDRESHD